MPIDYHDLQPRRTDCMPRSHHEFHARTQQEVQRRELLFRPRQSDAPTRDARSGGTSSPVRVPPSVTQQGKF